MHEHRCSLPTGPWIQLLYVNSFRSICEYEEAFFEEKIDFKAVLGPVCPICGENCGFRELTEYNREVRELWPARSTIVPIARFQCRGEQLGRTFSLLPWQLIPYCLYTVETVLEALLLWREYWRDDDGPGTAYQVVQSLPGQYSITSWQLHKWLMVIRHGLQAAHSELTERYDFMNVPSGDGVGAALEQVHCYLEAFSRGPPVRYSKVFMAVQIYWQVAGRFMFGRSSQDRTGAR